MKLNTQLIEQIRQGKAIHYDIDNVELLNEVLHEACTNSKQNAFGGNQYYVIHKDTWIPIPDVPQQSIPLSSFLTQDKQMVSVEEVLWKLDELAKEDSADTVRYSLQQFLTDKIK